MGLFDFLTGGKDPSKAANQYLNQIPGAVNPYYQPYINQGMQAGQLLGGEYGNLVNDPNSIYNKLGAGYKESPGYQHRLQQALQAGTNAQAAGGMAGSAQHEEQNMNIANDIAGKDFESYLNHILGLYGTGLQGEQGFQNQGFGASTGYGNMLGSNLAQQAGLAYNSQAGRNANQSKLFGNLINLGASFLPGVGSTISGLNLLPSRSYG